MLQPARERPVFFQVENIYYLKSYDGTQSLLKAPHHTFLQWFDQFPQGVELKISGYRFYKEGSKLIVQTGSNNAWFSTSQGFILNKRSMGFVVCNRKQTDAQFSDSDIRKRATLDTFIDFLDANLLLIHGVLNHSLLWVQRALIEGALPDMPFFDEYHKSLLHFCYETPEDYESSKRRIGRELIYWSANTKALLDMFPKSLITTLKIKNINNDINQIIGVTKIINKTLELPEYWWHEPERDDIDMSLVKLISTYSDGYFASHAKLKYEMQLYGYVGQLKIIRRELKEAGINKNGLFCGLGNFILDPLKRNMFMQCYMEGNRLLAATYDRVPAPLKLVPREAIWTENGLICDTLVVNAKRLEKAIKNRDIQKIKGILDWFDEYRKTPPKMLEEIDVILKTLVIEAAKDNQYEIITLLVNAQSNKSSLMQVAHNLYQNKETKLTGMLLPFSLHCSLVITQMMAMNFPTDISKQIIGFLGMVSYKQYLQATDSELKSDALLVKIEYLKKAVQNKNIIAINEILGWVSEYSKRLPEASNLINNVLEDLWKDFAKNNGGKSRMQIAQELSPDAPNLLPYLQHYSPVVNQVITDCPTAIRREILGFFGKVHKQEYDDVAAVSLSPQ